MLIWRRYRYYYRVIIHIPGVCLGFLPWNSMKKNLHYAIHVIHILHINLWHSSIERVVEGLEDVKVTKCPITTGRAVSWGLRLSFKFSFHWIPTVVCATNTWPATLHPTTLEQTTIDVQAMFWCVKRKYVLFFSQMLFYFVVCVLYIYIYSSIRVIHPKRFFFRQTRLMAESPWPKRPNASPWLQLVVMEALDIWRDPSSHPWRHDLTKIMGERWQLTPFWLFWKEKPPLQKHPTCLYNWRIKYRSMNKNEKFINVCWQLLHLTPYPKFA